MSMTTPYGTRRWLANAAAALVMLTAAPAQARTLRILVLGDSLAAGYGLAQADGFQAVMTAALRARGHDVQLLDAAVSGDTTAGGRARLDWALADGADAALVELGGNDGLRGLNPAGTEANLAAYALLGKKAPAYVALNALPVTKATLATSWKAVYNQTLPGDVAGVLGQK